MVTPTHRHGPGFLFVQVFTLWPQLVHRTVYSELSYVDVLSQDLKVMDTSAITLAGENELPILVCAVTIKSWAISTEGGNGQVLAGEGTFTTRHG